MKVKFRKKTSGWGVALLIVMLATLIFIGLTSSMISLIWFLFCMAIAIIILNDYEITNKGKLKGNGISIDIHRIQEVVYKEKDIEIHYLRKKNGNIKVLHYSPRDANGFVAKLKEINPNIQILKN